MKSKDQLKEYRALDSQTLRMRLKDSEEELMKLRFKHKFGAQLEKTDQLVSLRRSIARLNTVLGEKAGAN